jgi:predicted nuclease with TOPRIM domain
MAFTVSDFNDLVRLLEEHPEWRARLRHLILPEELLTLPELVRQNSEAISRLEAAIERLERSIAELSTNYRRLEEQYHALRAETDARFAEVAAQIRALTEAHHRLAEEFNAYRAQAEARFAELTDEVRNLAAAQKRTEERVEELAAAQKRTEERVEELAAAQKRTEERVEELAAAQKRTEDAFAAYRAHSDSRLDRLEAKVDYLATQVGRLSEVVGASLEEEAQSVVPHWLRQRGYRVLGDGYSLRVDGAGEVDVVLPVESPSGERMTVVVEAKVRISARSVIDWANRMRSEGFRKRLKNAGVRGPYLVYSYAMRIYPDAIEAAKESGIGLMSSLAVMADPAEPLPEE